MIVGHSSLNLVLDGQMVENYLNLIGTDDEIHSQPVTSPGHPYLVSALRVGLGKQIIITLTLISIPAIAYLFPWVWYKTSIVSPCPWPPALSRMEPINRHQVRGNMVEKLGAVHRAISQGKQQLLGLFLAKPCSLCQRSAPGPLCLSCERQIRQCQLPHPLDNSQASLPVLSWGSYDGSLRQALRRLKYEHQTGLAAMLGHELGRTWLQHLARPAQGRQPVVVPIPLHATRLQQRGFNQAALIAQGFCRQTRLPHYPEGLQRVLATEAQHRLNRQQRQANLIQAFAVNPALVARLRHTSVWLLDDIFTTGATVQAAAHALGRAGISVAGVCTVARASAWEMASQPEQHRQQILTP